MISEAEKEETLLEPEAEVAPEEPAEEDLMETMEKEVEAEESAETVETPVEEPLEEEVKPKKKKKGEEEEFVEEKTYTIPLSKALIMPPRKRSPRAMRILRAFVIKHMKIPSRAEEEDELPPTLTIRPEVNEFVWGRGIEKPPRKIRVRATKDKEGNVTVHLAEGA
ncbi:MAG: 50S ribosomal protein L31e [Candidatus Bathyarchaeota archaeon]|nr:50S ribosomal protein L31e [Candidatus Bathyarchaeota archaeon]